MKTVTLVVSMDDAGRLSRTVKEAKRAFKHIEDSMSPAPSPAAAEVESLRRLDDYIATRMRIG